MAIKKDLALDTGVNGEYWRIEKIVIEKNTTHVDLHLYKSKAAARTGKKPLERLSFLWSGPDHPCSAAQLGLQSAFKLCYDALKLLPNFADAIDDEEE